MPKTSIHHFPNHLACQTWTSLTLEHLPQAENALGEKRQYRKGSAIWRADDRADRIYFLKRGRVTVTTSDTHGHEVILRVIRVDEPFGELCFCAKEKGLRHTVARAVLESEAFEVSHKDFVDYLQQHRGPLNALLFTFCERLSEAERRVEVLAHRGAEERLGRLLLQLATAPGGEESKVVLNVSHEDLARMAAMSRSHVTVTMGKFRGRGFVHYGRNRQLMVDVPLLRAAVNKVRKT